MHILIGLALGVALLYFWLVGHWFARVLVFVGLGFIVALCGFGLGSRSDPVVGVLLAILFMALSWVLASLPVYYWRHQLKVKAVG